jgi:serine/threonine protein kinase
MSICPSCRKPVDARLTRCPWDGTPLGTVALDPLLGTALGGRYLLRKCIAERERIRLYTAEETATGRAVLATLVNTPRAGDAAAVERFRGRAEIGRSMDHPSCTVVRDYGLLSERQAFVIEEGEVWHQLGQELVLKGGRLPLSKALDLAIQMVEGLDHLHGKGLYNASVSSSSLRLVFDAQGALKLQIPTAEVIAHLLEDEQADLAEPSHALAQDLVAAARVLIEMLAAGSGSPPGEGAALPVDWVNLGLEDEARAKLQTILERALGRSKQKFGSAWEMRRELESLTGRSRLGRYTLLHRIAVGGMGEIYLARAEGIEGLDLNRLCVIKTIRTSLVQSAEFVERFLAEARVLASLSHGNIVPVHDVGKVGSVFYIAMEYVAGKDLRKILSRAAREKKRMSVPLALFIAKELANGLAYAHRAKVQGTGGLVHRDVSPHNTLVSYEGEVKLIDFGLARAGAELNRPKEEVVMGKVCYISPEQARAEPLDQRTDIYSAGLVLFELLTGEPFFNQPTIEEVLEHVGNPTLEPPSARVCGIPREVDRICMRAMAPRRDDRYLSAGALRDDLTAELARLAPRTNPEEVGHFVRSLFAAEQRDEETLITDLSTAIPPVVLGGGSDSLPISPEPTQPPQPARGGSEALSLLGRTPLPIQLATSLHEPDQQPREQPAPRAGVAALAPTLPGGSLLAHVPPAAVTRT